ncbi:hypothetical protein [Gordonia sp. VNK21]|uniref:Rv3212 family protein n=1 Tax=Gordonia sp. VNK21 TaxID=3382483 RepID=UPI0038D4CE9D
MAARIAPERRTRLDLIITAVIVVCVLVAGLLLWLTSPARKAELTTATTTPTAPVPGDQPPFELHELWRAKSAATDLPAVAQASVVIADGHSVTGRAIDTGAVLWRYRRAEPLCAAIAAWPGGDNEALAVFRNSRGCSEVTALNASSGLRLATRTSDADSRVQLSTDNSWVLAAGDHRLETWGSNLVRGIEYGRVTAPVNPDVSPDRRNCEFFSALPGEGRIAVIERCDGDAGYRLTVLGASLDSDEAITEWGSEPITATSSGPPPALISVGSSAVTVYDGGADAPAPGASPSIRVFTPEAVQVSTHQVAGTPGAPAGSHPITSQYLATFYTGAATVVVDTTTGQARYQLTDAIGPGEYSSALLVPVPGAVSVRDAADGKQVRRIPVDRGDYTGPVSLRVIGPYVVEQRGDEVVVLGPDAPQS